MILLNPDKDKEIVLRQNGRFLEFYKRNSPLMYKFDLSSGDFFCSKVREDTHEYRNSSDVKRWFRNCKLTTEDQKLYTMFSYGRYVCPDKENVKRIMEEFDRDRMDTVEKWAALGLRLDFNRGFGTSNYQTEQSFSIDYNPGDIPPALRTYLSSKTWSIGQLNNILEHLHDIPDTVAEIFDEINKHPEYESAFIRVNNDSQVVNDLHNQSLLNTLSILINEYNLKVPRLMIYLHYLNEIEKISADKLIRTYRSYLQCELEHRDGKRNKMYKYPNHYLSTYYIQQEVIRREMELDNYDLSEDAVANQHLEYQDDDFMIIVPKSPEDVQDEGRQQRHCIAQQYLNHIACGDTICVFMRRTSEPHKSLITIEIRNGTMRQACIGNNDEVPAEYKNWIRHWADLKGVIIDEEDSWKTSLIY